MEKLQNIVIDKNLPTYNYAEYLEALHREIEQDAIAEGLEKGLKQGIERGIEQGAINSALKMIKSGISIEKTSKILNLDINKLKSAMKE